MDSEEGVGCAWWFWVCIGRPIRVTMMSFPEWGAGGSGLWSKLASSLGSQSACTYVFVCGNFLQLLNYQTRTRRLLRSQSTEDLMRATFTPLDFHLSAHFSDGFPSWSPDWHLYGWGWSEETMNPFSLLLFLTTSNMWLSFILLICLQV